MRFIIGLVSVTILALIALVIYGQMLAPDVSERTVPVPLDNIRTLD